MVFLLVSLSMGAVAQSQCAPAVAEEVAGSSAASLMLTCPKNLEVKG